MKAVNPCNNIIPGTASTERSIKYQGTHNEIAKIGCIAVQTPTACERKHPYPDYPVQTYKIYTQQSPENRHCIVSDTK